MKFNQIYTAFAGAVIIFSFACNEQTASSNTNTEKLEDKTLVEETSKNVENPPPQENPFKDSKIEIKTYQTDVLVTLDNGKTDRGWGYDVLVDGKVYVHQPHIPAIQGNYSFRSSEDAKKIATLVIYKLKNNIVPPSLSVEEIDSLGISK